MDLKKFAGYNFWAHCRGTPHWLSQGFYLGANWHNVTSKHSFVVAVLLVFAAVIPLLVLRSKRACGRRT